jgi:hypothetical protein
MSNDRGTTTSSSARTPRVDNIDGDAADGVPRRASVNSFDSGMVRLFVLLLFVHFTLFIFCSHQRHRLTVLRPPLHHRSDRCKKTILAVERTIRRHKYDE